MTCIFRIDVGCQAMPSGKRSSSLSTRSSSASKISARTRAGSRLSLIVFAVHSTYRMCCNYTYRTLYTQTCMYIWVYVYLYIHIYTHVFVCFFVPSFICLLMSLFSYVYTNRHTYIHANTCIPISATRYSTSLEGRIVLSLGCPEGHCFT